VSVRLSKGHGTGNDFVVVGDPDGTLDLSAAAVRALCDRHTGIGADGLLRVVRTVAVPDLVGLAGQAEWAMDYRNADGSIAEMCGNGVRVHARWMHREGLVRAGRLQLATRGGVKVVDLPESGDVTVGMGPARLPDLAVAVNGHKATAVDMGNPHLVVPLTAEEFAALPVPLPPPALSTTEHHPDGVNVEYVVVEGPGRMRLRVHERGVGETMSCGTGAVAAAAAAVLWHSGATAVAGTLTVPAEAGTLAWEIAVPGGVVRVGLAGTATTLAGPAVVVADLTLDGAWQAALAG
jgi:diaminopimelate epimerase